MVEWITLAVAICFWAWVSERTIERAQERIFIGGRGEWEGERVTSRKCACANEYFAMSFHFDTQTQQQHQKFNRINICIVSISFCLFSFSILYLFLSIAFNLFVLCSSSSSSSFGRLRVSFVFILIISFCVLLIAIQLAVRQCKWYFQLENFPSKIHLPESPSSDDDVMANTNKSNNRKIHTTNCKIITRPNRIESEYVETRANRLSTCELSFSILASSKRQMFIFSMEST